MKFVLLLLLICINGAQNIELKNQCQCSQLYEIDCYRNQSCLWNKLQLQCEIKKESTNNNSTNTNKITTYCTKFTSDKCWQTEGCAYILNECVQFTACSSYPFSVQELCQMVSKKCVTDGEKCVEIGECNTYLTSVSCIQNTSGKYCYWDQQCIDANDCDKLPNWFRSDLECRQQISYCTINPKGGCQLSGYNCQDQQYEMQCYYDQKMNPCAWFNNQCINRSCDTALNTLKTDQQCQEYLDGCTLNQNGGCRQRTQCNDVILMEACTFNAVGQECFWNNGICYDKTCENAQKDIICSQFLSNCVPKLKGGCMSISECTQYELQEACIIDKNNNQCYWTGKQCVIHTCINAPLEYITHEQCTQFKQDCTVNQQTFQGCVQRTCDNAPTTATTYIATNYDCNEYLSGCITKLGGGCKQLKDCIDIDIDIACVVDNKNRRCFYYNGQCKLLTCENAPLEYNTHQQCQEFSQECTVTRTLSGCVKMSCQVLTSQDTCKIDSNNNRCFWTGLCYQKTCQNAPFDYDSDQICKNYLSTCTVANSGRGCIVRPSSCTLMVLEDQCKVTSQNQICGWFEGACYNKACFTAPNNSDNDTYEECHSYLNGCTVASEGNGGCIPLDQCTTYTAQRSCRYNQLNLLCEWTGSACYDKSCTTAPSDKVSNTDCNGYLSGCIVSPTGSGCVSKPTSCSLVSTSLQCTNLTTNSGPCVWTTSCVDRTCANAPISTDYDTHQECYTFLPSCTVQLTGVGGCMTQYTYCYQYTTFRSCQLTNTNQQCAWYNNYCYNRQCSYGPDSSDFDSDSECSTFQSSCTVLRRINTLGCTTRYSNCQDLSQNQCIKDSNGNLCTWNTNAATPYCITRACNLMIGYTYTQDNCQNWMPSCVVDNSATHTSCMGMQYYCVWYNNQDNCKISVQQQCTWDGSNCANRTCTIVQNVTDYNHTNCNAWMNTCTVGKPTSCIIKPTNCADYVNYDQCYKNISNFPCTWVSGACIEKTCTNHGYYVTTFNQANCNGWLSLCSVNPGSTACEPTRTCSNYTGATFTHTDCTSWLSTCTTDGSQCVQRTCTNYGSNVTTFNSSNCSTWFSECTNDSTTACKSNRTCSNYGSKVTVFNHTNCMNWLSTCTNTNTACTTRTCSNYGNNILYFSHTTCNAWLSTCTVSWDGLTCENKTCYNYGQQVTTFDTTTCQGWLAECQGNANQTACETSKTCITGNYNTDANCQAYNNQCTFVSGSYCTNRICTSTTGITVFTHRTCTNFFSQCTVASSSSCQWRTCYNTLLSYFTHESCEKWLFQCTVNATSTGCTVKTCTNYGSHVTSFTDADCNKWHPSCNGSGGTTCVEARVCGSAPANYRYAHTNCEGWSLSCTESGSTTCEIKSCGKASNAFSIFNHANCQEWLSTCTANLTSSACVSRTCTNYKDQVTTISHATCSTWLAGCTSNVAGTACETKSCYNHGSQVATIDDTNCGTWLTGCVAGTTTCREAHYLCSAYSGTYSHASCYAYLSTCTNNSTSTKCITKTCAATSGVTIFNHINCTSWYKECTVSATGSACQDRTCTNYGDHVTVFTNANCSAWLTGCNANATNDACISARTCSNYGTYILEFSHETCSHWLNTCTVNGGGTACIDRTCSNYGTNVTVFTYANCNSWLAGCTGFGGVCDIHTCANSSSYITVFNEANCYNWYSYCQVNSAMNACESTRTCTNYASNVTTFDHTNCNAWLSSCTVNAGGTACETKTCTNTNISAGNFNLTNCSAWLSTCIANAGADNCETSVKTCANAVSNLSTFTQSTCSTWKSTCIHNTQGTSDPGTGCMEYTCANAVLSPFSHTNCQAYLSTCTVNSNTDGCETLATCDQAAHQGGTFTHTDCKAFLSTCTVNSAGDGCVAIACDQASNQGGTFTHTDCKNFLSSCTVNSGGTGCVTIACDQAINQGGTFSHTTCQDFSSTCTVTSDTTGCVDFTCANLYQSTGLTVNYSNCNSYKSDCTNKSDNSACETKSCSNGAAYLNDQILAINDANCYSWLSTCTVNHDEDACETRTCANASNSQAFSSSYDCTSWLSTCELNSSNNACVTKTCTTYRGPYSAANCQAYFPSSTCTYYGNYDNISICTTTVRTCASSVDAFGNGFTVQYQSGCDNWLPGCAYRGTSFGYGCEARTCANYVTANLSNPTTHSQCYNWLNTCTFNAATSTCTERTCANFSQSAVNHTNCEAWNNLCTANSDSSGCERKNCENFSRVNSIFRTSLCVAWYSNCQANSSLTACETDCTSTSVTPFNFANCQDWDPFCSINSAGDNCEKKNCLNAHLATYSNANCFNWVNTCTNNGTTACQDRTCYNYLTNILSFTQNVCNSWLSSCTNYSTLGCMPKMCENYSGTISDANCSTYLSYCVADVLLTKCITFRTCADATLSSYTHVDCEGWMSNCTNNGGSTACIDKTCANIKVSVVLQLNSYTCPSWKSTCTYSNNSCVEKTCSNSGLSGTDVTATSCANWLPYCRANNTMWPQYCELKTCQNHSISTFNHVNCQSWLSYCTVNSIGNACMTERTCPSANLVTFNHINCERWLSNCTVNTTNDGCLNKTCYNTNLTTFNDQTCGQWLNTCKANSTYTGCELRTCTNYGNQITVFNASTCGYWLYQCTNSGSTACQTTRTCSNYGTLIQSFDMMTCSQYLSTCVPDPTNSTCMLRTCSNARELPSYTLQNCSNWLSTCTVNGGNNACIDRTCANATLSSFNHNSCNGWLNTCTVNSTNDGCTAKTCTNSIVISYTQANCIAWLSTCTNGTNACIDKTCFNITGTINQANCSAWLSYCYADTASQTQCQSLRTCYNHNLSTFTVATCSAWSPLCTLNTTNDGCMEKTCYNSNLTKFSHTNCSGWLSTCTVNTLGTGCEVRSCINHGNNITQFNDTNCAAWWKYCKVTTLTNACEPKTCWSTNVVTFNHTNCYNYLDQCTVGDSTSCGSTRTCANAALTVFNHANCSFWLTKCTINGGGTACEDMTCANAQVTKYTHNNCQNWMFSCTVNLDGTACETKTCSNYGANVVVYTHANCLAWLSTCTANSTGSACVNKTCINTTGISTWTEANCEGWLSVCQLDKPSTCQNNLGDCSSATYNQCVKDNNSDTCVWYQNSCQDRSCSNFSGTASHTNCENWLSTCTINTAGTGCVQKPANCTGASNSSQCVISYSNTPCAWTTSCVNRACTHFSGTFNHTNCQAYLSSCTVNSTANACQTKAAACSTYTTSDQCQLSSSGTVCFWIAATTSCVNRTCEHADQTASFNTDDECKAFLSSCTVARIGGCTDKLSTCATYLQESQCYMSISSVKCYWNPLTSLCGDAICSNAPTTLTTHEDCQGFLTTCTVKNTGGCIPLAACTTYGYAISCIISSTGDVCEWLNGHCYVKACTTAASTRVNHEDCQAYMPNCTVAASGTGCVALNDCNTYTAERQCIINASNLLCGWNGLVCADRACTTAPPNVNFSNDNSCSSYMDGCTVVSSGYGCTRRSQNCSDYLNSRQCVKTLSGQLCYWNSELPIPVCEVRTCFNAPSTSITPLLCEQHLNTCYSNMQYCRLEVCEDLLFTTDFECKYFNSVCTTDGTKCVVRGKCEDMKNAAGCVMSDDFTECEWYNQQCVVKTCFTSPPYVTEEDCNYYKSGCTTKLFGGCRPKTTCQDATVEAACTTSVTGENCIWENGYCRVVRCEDFDGSYDEMCDAQKSGCVSDGTNCIQPRYCSQILVKDQCLKGVDGPCVWYEFGCALFLSCSSIQSNLDRVCKSANKLCTTDGIKCMGLDYCANYRLKEQCNTGLDGNCQWFDQQSKCLIFKKCSDLPFLTHQECNQVSSKCTTDTLNGCIDLTQCFKYKQKEQCRISSDPQKTENNLVVKTGYCAWMNDKCRDQTCEDLTGEVHESCAAKLKGCTSNGTSCISMQPCTKYSDLMTCNIALGSDGKCIYSSGGCRPLECTDIKNGTNHYLCQSYNSTCISDGTECIPQVKCEYYPNQYACTYVGIDGQCTWNGEKCGLMSSCQDAYLDMIACQRMGERCNWQTYTNGTSSCLPHTCTTKGTRSQCNYIKSFDDKTIQTCTLLNEQCVSIDPTFLLSSDCFQSTLYTYRWNPESNLCESCNKQINNTNSTTVSYAVYLTVYVLTLII